MRSHKLCDVSKGAACIKMAAAKLGWVGRSRRLVSITRTPELDFFIGLPRPARYLCVYTGDPFMVRTWLRESCRQFEQEW